MSTSTAAAATSECCSSSNSTNTNNDNNNCKFERDWLQTLLQKHAHNHPSFPPSLQSKGGLAALVSAPMVDASDLPYRLLTRRYNTNLCFTPMIHARMFTETLQYRRKFWKYNEGMPDEDRPLIAQFCGHDKDILLKAMQIVEPHVDAVDVNCGCPQGIAKRGRYGAYLMEEGGGDRIVTIVKHLTQHLNVPVTVKLRILPSGIDDSLRLYERLVDAGAAMLTIHGRTREQRGHDTGAANWDDIKRVVELVGHRVPIIANGGICNMDDVRRCLEVTGADGVMSSESILEYPPLFTETNVESTNYKRTGPSRLQMAQDYLELCKQYPPEQGGQGSGFKCIGAHLHRFLHADLQVHTELRDAVIKAYSIEDAEAVIKMVRDVYDKEDHDVSEEQVSWYIRHRLRQEEDDRKREGYIEEKKETSGVGDEDEGECPVMCFGEVCGEDDGDY